MKLKRLFFLTFAICLVLMLLFDLFTFFNSRKYLKKTRQYNISQFNKRRIYLKNETKNDSVMNECSSETRNLTGKLDINSILQSHNLTGLIEFYNFNKTKETYLKKVDKNKKFDLFYLSLDEKWLSKMPLEHQILWKSNDVELINDSFYGELGGSWKPTVCNSDTTAALIIPFKNRLPQLKVLLHFLHLILQRQLLDYRIYVVEPNTPDNVRFNKGRVLNSAFLEALKDNPRVNCVLFHDADLLPEDDRILYQCKEMPLHLSSLIDRFDYVLLYKYLVGGVLAIRPLHYRLVNGYSNTYWGWGGEDDDLSVRIAAKKLKILRPPEKYARYKMMRHKFQLINPNRFKYLKKSKQRFGKDGLNSINYKIIERKLYPGFTYLLVDIGKIDD